MIDALMLLGSLGAFLLLLLIVGRSRHSGGGLGIFAFREEASGARNAATKNTDKRARKGAGNA